MVTVSHCVCNVENRLKELKMEVERPVRRPQHKSGHKTRVTWTRERVKELKCDWILKTYFEGSKEKMRSKREKGVVSDAKDFDLSTQEG